jgi:putative endonuclease
MQNTWTVYLLRCKSGALYCGITNNLEARIEAHKNGTGAKYTRANPPICLAAKKDGFTKSEAAKIEYAIKRVPARRKIEALKSI